MKVEQLTSDRLEDFIKYCRKHRMEGDDSFLYDEDLRKFNPDAENPTYIAVNEQGELKAAASLIMDEYQRRGKKARFRIFHSEINDVVVYRVLMQALLKHTGDLEKLVIFVPEMNRTLKKYIERVGFSIDRYAFLLVRADEDILETRFPEDYSIRDFIPGQDEKIWSEVRNAGFAALRGSETPVTLEMVSKMISGEDYLEGGMKILFHMEKPVGVVRGVADEYMGEPIMNIGPLAIIPEYQGKGLGRQLLRASLHYAKEKAYQNTILSVNGENERAKALYLQEGFREVESAACYHYDLTHN